MARGVLILARAGLGDNSVIRLLVRLGFQGSEAESVRMLGVLLLQMGRAVPREVASVFESHTAKPVAGFRLDARLCLLLGLSQSC